MFNQVKNWMDLRPYEFPRVVLCDIPRSAAGFINYSVFEKLKDGLLYSGKYEGGVCALDNIHLICFANDEPTYYEVSEDRWNICKI